MRQSASGDASNLDASDLVSAQPSSGCELGLFLRGSGLCMDLQQPATTGLYNYTKVASA